MRYLRSLLILALIFLAIWRLYPHISDFSQIAALKNNLNLIWLLVALACQIGQYIGDGWLSQLLLRIVGVRIDFKTTLKIASIDVFAAHLFPIGEAGALATSFYFYRKLGVDRQSLIFLSVAWAATTTIILVLMLLAAIIFLPHLPRVPLHISNIVAYLTAALLAAVIAIYLKRDFFLPKLKKYFGRLKLFSEILKFFTNLKVHRQVLLANKPLVAKALFAAFIYYATNIATLSFAFLIFGKLPNLMVVTVAYFLSLIAGWITLAPAGLGATDASLILIFLQFGFDPAQSVAASLLFRLISFWLPIPFGIISYASLRKSSGT